MYMFSYSANKGVRVRAP